MIWLGRLGDFYHFTMSPELADYLILGNFNDLMNKRIYKKIHLRFLPDIGVEIFSSNEWTETLENLEVGGIQSINNRNIPSSFFD